MSRSDWNAPDGTTALIFDCDGTLADTMPIHFRAWTAMLNRHGLSLTETRFYELGGIPTSRIIRILAAEQNVVVSDVESMIHEKESIFLESLAEVQAVVPVRRIAETHRTRFPLAVASGGYRDIVHQTLEIIGVRTWFPVVVTAEDTTRHKPDPDVFLEAARRLNVRAEGCVVFEDTDVGLEAARRAGMTGIDIRTFLTSTSP